VLSLSQVIGEEVWGLEGQASDGSPISQLARTTEPAPHLVERILVSRRRGPDLVVPWAAAERFEHTGVVMRGNDDRRSLRSHRLLMRLEKARSCSSATSATRRSSI
jgi:hypothetical protein